MQSVIADHLNTFNRLSSDLTERAGNMGKTFWASSAIDPWDLSPWAQFGKAWLSATKFMTDAQSEAYTNTLRSPIREKQLTAIAESTREVGQIMRDFTVAVTQRQLDTCSGVTSLYADSLDGYKQAGSASDLFAVQLQLPTNIQNLLKEHYTGMFELFSSLQTALTAWGENSLSSLSDDSELSTSTAQKSLAKSENVAKVTSVG